MIHSNRLVFLLYTICISRLLLSCHPAGPEQAQFPEKPNFLFIAIDDLRPQLNIYGKSQIKSPNIDKLAGEGVVFKRAFCQQPICMASRVSLLSGIYPSNRQIYSCQSVEHLIPEVTTLHQHFAQNGYATPGTGKIYHHSEDSKKHFGEDWLNKLPKLFGRGYLTEASRKIIQGYHGVDSIINHKGPAYEMADVPDNAYSDGAFANFAIEQLGKFKDSGEPFFLSVGFKKPHLPFNAPQKYWEMYDKRDIQFATNPFLPENATRFTPFNFGEIRGYTNIPNGNEPIPDSIRLKLIHGYYACVSYIDAQVGRVMDKLEALDMSGNTIVVLWGDHGFKLGEHGMWGKHTCFEIDARVPLIVKVPGAKSSGKQLDQFVELIDLYPTLSELAGLEVPAHIEGQSLVPLLQNPEAPFRQDVFTVWPSYAAPRTNPDEAILGLTLQDDRYRYIEWTKMSTGEVLATELYDHDTDPREDRNVASLDEYQQDIEYLSERLQQRLKVKMH